MSDSPNAGIRPGQQETRHAKPAGSKKQRTPNGRGVEGAASLQEVDRVVKADQGFGIERERDQTSKQKRNQIKNLC